GESPAPGDGLEQDSANSKPVRGGDLIIGSIGSPTLFNPLYSDDTPSSDIEYMIFDSLVRSDVKFNTVTDGGLATDIAASDDGLTYTVKIKENVKFHDGELLTADDV